MTTDITELAQSLKAAAEKATPGRWEYYPGNTSIEYNVDSMDEDQGSIVYVDSGDFTQAQTERNGEFIALANPASILALVEALEKAQQMIDELEGRMALAAMDSSESVELPLDYLQGHKDGLEWAARLAEANHPETGDWLYDDPIELAKAIRKGPDMPPAQPAPVVPEEMTPEMMRSVQLNSELGAYAASNLSGAYDLFAEFWKEACRSAMLQAEPVCTCPSGDGSLRWPCPVHPGNSPVIPDGWIPVSERMPEIGDIVLTAMGGVVNVGEMECSAANYRFFTSVISGRELPATHWMPLPAAPREVK
ncbi:TPA: DUF551 domain-containing protein [Klebsiella pneumoniae]|nr:DUF551 domain-containing protein [Klebsiella pneumoniae]